MKSAYQRVVELSVALIKAHPEGVRYIDLREHALKKLPDLNKNTLSGALNRFRNDLPEGVIRPVRGLYTTPTDWSKRDKKEDIPTRAARGHGVKR